jgi:DNA-binding transcriptional ArsR family regulator
MLDDILFGKTRAAILRELYLNPDRRISFNELVRRLKSGAGAVSRELKVLIASGLITEEREGNHRFLTAGKQSPLFAELKAFVTKASGAPSIVRDALRDLEDRIELAFVFGSVAKGIEHADSDLDLFVIGTAGYSLVSERVHAAEGRLGRKVQTLYFDTNSPADRVSLRKSSMQAMLSGPRLFVIGNESQLQRYLSDEGKGRGKTGKSRQSD